MTRYGFVIDLKRCYSCYGCQMTCKAEHFSPPGVFFARVLKGEAGKYPGTLRQGLPVLCMQCAKPPCKDVCPTKATKQNEVGVVTIDKNLCIGCKYCLMTCPYGARQFTEKWTSYFPDGQPLTPFEEHARTDWIDRYGEGTATKCDFCLDRVREGKNPACVDSCPAKARYLGDLEDPESEVSSLIKRERGFVLNPEFGTEPSVYYLPPR